MNTKSSSGLKVKTAIKAAGLWQGNHTGSGLRIKTAVKAGGLWQGNHTSSGLRVKTAIKAGTGIWLQNHNTRGVAAA